ncbi:MAG: TldD/PmbA family protein [Candidatus Eisenbacteria bacterium]|uniref:TldD/PmbA family protein n=1 Tax=Eiseniibacteriota bacterium TaxID=2212470 RepID=A0A938BQH4_UNCEI|nr:TldD/PmbA family protein [Candidatus Eisenbacteria bacterium]
MSRELLDRVRVLVDDAGSRGARGMRGALTRSRSSQVRWRDGELEQVRESTTMSLELSLFVEGRFSSHTTSDLRPDALREFLDETIAMTRLLAEDPHRRLPDPERYAGRCTEDLQLCDAPGAASLTGVERRRLARTLEEAARSEPGSERIISVDTRASDGDTETVVVASNGMEGVERNTYFVYFARCTVRDDGDRRPMDYSYAVALQRSDLPAPESIGATATRRALALCGQRPRPGGTYACVIENRAAGNPIGSLFEPLQGHNIQQGQSCLADKAGQQIASPLLTIIDDPHIVRGLGSSTFDSEGMATRRRPIIERGVLRGFYLNTYYASRLGLEPTTGSQGNLVFEPGPRDLEGLLQAMGTGLLVTDFVGGNSNATTGDFSVGVSGHWIEGGRRVHPVSGMNLAGNLLQSWHKLVEVGSDAFPYGEVRVPSLRFEGLQFSGV